MMRKLQALLICAVVAAVPQAVPAAPLDANQKTCFDDSGDAAIAACTRAINTRRHKGEMLARLYGARAYEYKGKNDLDRALADYNEAIRIFPNVIENLDSRATLYVQKGNYLAAIGDYTAALKLKNSGYAAVNKADAHLRLKEYDQAMANYRQGSNLDAKDPTDFERRCFARAVVGDARLALADCEESLRRRPNHSFTIGSRGLAYLKLGRYDEAISDYDRAMTRVKDVNGLAFEQYGRGVAKMKKGDVEGGKADMDAVKKDWPEIAEVFARFNVR